jgi:hypothetical protein
MLDEIGICHLDFDIWNLANRDCHASPSLCSGLWLTAMTSSLLSLRCILPSCHCEEHSDEAISVGAIEIATLPLRYAQGFGSPQ